MKNRIEKICSVMKSIFGYGIFFCLFAGALTFFGYVAAIVMGGDAAALLCEVIYKKVIPVIIYTSTGLVLFGLLIMYISGEQALTTKKK